MALTLISFEKFEQWLSGACDCMYVGERTMYKLVGRCSTWIRNIKMKLWIQKLEGGKTEWDDRCNHRYSYIIDCTQPLWVNLNAMRWKWNYSLFTSSFFSFLENSMARTQSYELNNASQLCQFYVISLYFKQKYSPHEARMSYYFTTGDLSGACNNHVRWSTNLSLSFTNDLNQKYRFGPIFSHRKHSLPFMYLS